MRVRPDLPAQNVSWLNRHDRESGDLYGMLPLMIGMPVAVTEHINRSYDKIILKGRVGYIHSWVLAPDEKKRIRRRSTHFAQITTSRLCNVLI